MRRIFCLVCVGLLGLCDAALAANWYATTIYKSPRKNFLVMITLTHDRDACEALLDGRKKNLTEEWRFAHDDCAWGPKNDALYQGAFSDRPVSGTYISFFDEHGRKTLVKLMEVKPWMMNASLKTTSALLAERGYTRIKIIKAK